MENKLKYFIYCRKSSEEEDRQILSIDAQLRELKEFAQKCSLHVVDILTESKSAHKPGREIFNSMLQKIEGGEADAILVWQINRLARNALDGGQLIWAMDQGKIRQIDTPHKQFKNNGDDKFFMTLEFGMAKKYSDDLSDNIKRGLKEKYKRGEYPNYAPVGYINTKINGYSNISHDPDRAPLVIKVFEEYATGNYSLGKMIETFEKWGLKTRKNTHISKSHLQKILTNPIYYGYFEQKGELYKGSFEPLISKELFDRVQDAVHNRSKPKKQYFDWAYNGLIKCGCGCGASIIFETKRKYYKGTDRWAEYTYARSSKRCKNCFEKGITLDNLEKQILEKVKNVSINKEKWKLGIELLQVKYEHAAKEQSVIVENFNKERETLKKELDGYFKMRAREEMSGDDFKVKKNDLLSKIASIEEKINNAMKNEKFWLERVEEFLNTAFQARDMILSDDLEAKRKAVKKIGWNLKLKDGKLVWNYQMPYDILLVPDYRSNMSNSTTKFETISSEICKLKLLFTLSKICDSSHEILRHGEPQKYQLMTATALATSDEEFGFSELSRTAWRDDG